MGALFSKKQLRILLLGLDSAGKTTLLRVLTGGPQANRANQPPEPTVGFSVETVRVKKTRLDVWDLGGQERQRVLWRHYYAGTNALIFVVDSVDTGRLGEAGEELFRLLNERDLLNCTVLILANKQDSPHHLPIEEIARSLQLPDPGPDGIILANGHICKLMPVAGATGVGVNEAISWLLTYSSEKRKAQYRQTVTTAKERNNSKQNTKRRS